VLCEMMNPDGTMMRGDAIARYAAVHGLVALTVAELADYRRALALQASGHKADVTGAATEAASLQA